MPNSTGLRKNPSNLQSDFILLGLSQTYVHFLLYTFSPARGIILCTADDASDQKKVLTYGSL